VSRFRSTPRGKAASRAQPPRVVRISALAAMAGVSTATIKHYLREGLLPGPEQRTGRTMAYYDARLVDRVKAIKDLQQQRYLPLKVIADVLEPSPSARLRGEPAPSPPASPAPLAPARARTRREVLAELAVGPPDLDLLAQLGLVAPSGRVDGDPVFAGPDLALLEVLHEIRATGLAALFPLAILEPYAVAIRALVRVEVEQLRRQLAAGARPLGAALDETAREATAMGERLVLALRDKLIVPELQAMIRPEPPAPPAPSRRAPRRRRH
jgi:DNA-binding transcriptional MerR regulator